MSGDRPNVLFITADQWRGDCIGAAGHPTLKTPNIDALAAEGCLFRNHYAACAPCSPARASIYTGLYQFNHRVVQNGTPLDDRFDNVARAARRAGYDPTLFGYTDTAPDPRRLHRSDPALLTYEGILPGFTVRQGLPEDDGPWLSWLAERGHRDLDPKTVHAVPEEAGHRISLAATLYSAEETQTAFLTEAFLRWLGEPKERPWFAHVSFLRPHPPFAVPAPYNGMYDPADGPEFERASSPETEAAAHPFVAAIHATRDMTMFVPGDTGLARDLSDEDYRRLRAIYYGMISEVDTQIGRLLSGLADHGMTESTLVVLTSDHGEMMGDHWMVGKGGYHRQSYHVPLIVRSPDGAPGRDVDHFTSATDLFPTLLDYLGAAPRHIPDGLSLRPFIRGGDPPQWRDAAIFEYDFRNIRHALAGRAEAPAPHACSLISRLTDRQQYVSFGGSESLLIEREIEGSLADSEGDTPTSRPQRLEHAEALLKLLQRHTDRTLADQVVWDFATTT